MKLFHVHSKSRNRYLILAEDESDAIEVAYINGCVRKRYNVVKLEEITDLYKSANPLFDPDSLSRGELCKFMDTNYVEYYTHLKEIK